MYTVQSEIVTTEQKKKIMVHIATLRPFVKEECISDFLDGSLFDDDEQVFQIFCMANIKLGRLECTKFNLPKLIENALITAGECDYYHMCMREY